MSLVKRFGLAYLQAVLAFVLFHAAADDFLFFTSDAASLVIYIAVSALLLALALFASSYALRAFPARAQAVVYSLFLFALLSQLFVAFIEFTIFTLRGKLAFGVMLAPYFELETLNAAKQFLSGAPLWIGLLLLVASFVFWKRALAYIVGVSRRIEQVALATLVVSLVLTPVAYALQRPGGASPTTGTRAEPRQLVLIVLDALPAHYLPVYDRNAKPNKLDRIFRRGRVLTNLRTNAPYTNAYFGTLYSGRLKPEFGGENLLSRLQDAGVAVRWMSYHRNGFPDGSSARTSRYRGLRSYFLTPRTAWIPKALGVPYHLDLSGDHAERNFIAKLLAPLVFDGLENSDGMFESLLMPSLIALRRQSKRSFLIFHLAHYKFSTSARAAPDPQTGRASGGDSAFVAGIHANEYRYEAKNEPVAARQRVRQEGLMEALGQELESFFKAFERAGLTRNTAIILTSDHGIMFRKGRFWYGYHPNDEVVRVPGVIFKESFAGTDNRLFDTRDVAASIQDYFGIDRPPGEGGVHSFFSPGPGRRWVATLTMRSDKFREWFLVLTDAERNTYRLNLHPAARGGVERILAGEFHDTVVERWPAPPDGLWPTVVSFLRLFGVSGGEIHKTFRDRLARAPHTTR